MSVVGHQRTSDRVGARSADALIADIAKPHRHVRKVPKAEAAHLFNHLSRWLTSAVHARRVPAAGRDGVATVPVVFAPAPDADRLAVLRGRPSGRGMSRAVGAGRRGAVPRAGELGTTLLSAPAARSGTLYLRLARAAFARSRGAAHGPRHLGRGRLAAATAPADRDAVTSLPGRRSHPCAGLDPGPSPLSNTLCLDLHQCCPTTFAN